MQNDEFAGSLANRFGEQFFEARRGVALVPVEEDWRVLLVYFNNNPYAKDQGARPRETERIINRLDQAGFSIAGRGLCDEGYTEVLLIRPVISSEATVFDAKRIATSIVDQEMARTFEELLGA